MERKHKEVNTCDRCDGSGQEADIFMPACVSVCGRDVYVPSAKNALDQVRMVLKR